MRKIFKLSIRECLTIFKLLVQEFLSVFYDVLCIANLHDYRYDYQKIKGVSDFGEHEANIYCRVCKNCKKRQTENFWGWETF